MITAVFYFAKVVLANAQATTQQGGKMKILVVDDEPSVRKILVRYFGKLGYEVKHAENGQVAWAILQRENFDLLLTDKDMPEMGGLELISRTKQLKPELRIVLMSGDPNFERGSLSGIIFIEKPIPLEELEKILREAH